MKSDIEIAQEAQMVHIREVAAKLDIPEDDLELYGKYTIQRRRERERPPRASASARHSADLGKGRLSR